MEPVCATDEGVAVLHAEALHKDSAVSVWVSFELHSHGDIVTLHCFLQGCVGRDFLAISHEDSCVFGGLD